MPNVVVRRLSAEEAPEVFYPIASYAFGSSPPQRNRAEYIEFKEARSNAIFVAAYEDGRAVAVAAASPMTQNVRGKLWGAGGVWGVASHPAARRNGYVRLAMSELLSLMRQAGQAVSELYPFRESFYERLGYMAFPRPHTVKIVTAGLAPLLKKNLGGSVELLSIADGYDAYRAYLLRRRERTHGMAVFDNGEGEKAAAIRRNDLWVALATAGGEVVGVMIYNLRPDSTENVMHVRRFYYDTSQGRYLLLQWIGRHIDQAQRADLWLPPTEQPETWLTDLLTGVEHGPRAGAMGRIVDVMRLAGLPVGEGGLAVRLSDPTCPWNDGCWRIEAVGGSLCISPAAHADCELTIQGLSALVFGTHDPADFSVRGWGQASISAQGALRRIFPPMIPFMHETF